MIVALVFGSTPLAHRIAYYINAYTASRDIPAAVHRAIPAGMEEVQNKVWGTYTSASHSGRPTLVINASEINELGVGETNPDRAWRENTRHAAHIAYAARTADIPLIHLSTEHVFRGNSGPYAAVKEPRNPVNVYGATKWYAEHAVQKIHPFQQPGDKGTGDKGTEKGTRIIRTSALYGFDVNSYPARLTRREGDEIVTSGVVRDGTRTTPSFIGEVAFLIARNIVHGSGLSDRIIHVGPDVPNITWGNYLHGLGAGVLFEEQRRPDAVRKGESRGLKPSPGWHLPRIPQKSFIEFQEEYRTKGYTKYWNE